MIEKVREGCAREREREREREKERERELNINLMEILSSCLIHVYFCMHYFLIVSFFVDRHRKTK